MKSWRKWGLPWWITILLLTLPLAGCFGQDVTPIDPTKQLTEFTKPAVVRVVSYNAIMYRLDAEVAATLGVERDVTFYDGGTGSGALLTPDGYVVTNAHVIETAELTTAEAQNRVDTQFIEQLIAQINTKAPDQKLTLLDKALTTTEFTELERVHKVVLPGGDEYPFYLKSYGDSIGEGKDVAILKINASHLPTVSVDENDQVQTADKVMIAGYPGKADLDGYLDDQSALVSTYTSGAIAARKNSANGPLLQLDANINHGNSGGPVFTLDGKMVGIATATSEEGIGWAIPASTVLEFTKQAGVSVNQPNTVNENWQAGLTAFWQGYFSKALSKFADVQRLNPKHYEVGSYIARSQAAIDGGRNKLDLGDYFPYLLAGGTLCVLMAGTWIVFSVRRRRNRVRRDWDEF